LISVLIWAVLQTSAFVVPIFVLYMGWRFVRAYERRPRGELDESTSRRLDQLEESIIRIDSEFNKLAEEQRFLTRLLSERQTHFGEVAP